MGLTKKNALILAAATLLAAVIFIVPDAASAQSGARISARLDPNRDGRVSAAEFPGPAARFARLDIDHDGVLSPTEIRVGGMGSSVIRPRGRSSARGPAPGPSAGPSVISTPGSDAGLTLAGGPDGGPGADRPGRSARTCAPAVVAGGLQVPFIDTHAHLSAASGPNLDDYRGAAEIAVATMDDCGIEMSILMPPPRAAGQRDRSDHEPYIELARAFPGRFAYLGGGGSLNPMIHAASARGSVGDADRAAFAARAEQILRDGALGFGELTALHFSMADGHPFLQAPPDHPLFLLLADIAARHGVPIDLHMEAADRDLTTPPAIARRGSANPARIEANQEPFERLLAHNRGARIVWVHFGWDNTGQRTTDRARRLLETHENLFISIKIAPDALAENPLRAGGISPDWVALISDYPDRFVIGADQFHIAPAARIVGPPSVNGARAVLDGLPPELARRVGMENARRIYNLGAEG